MVLCLSAVHRLCYCWVLSVEWKPIEFLCVFVRTDKNDRREIKQPMAKAQMTVSLSQLLIVLWRERAFFSFNSLWLNFWIFFFFFCCPKFQTVNRFLRKARRRHSLIIIYYYIDSKFKFNWIPKWTKRVVFLLLWLVQVKMWSVCVCGMQWKKNCGAFLMKRRKIRISLTKRINIKWINKCILRSWLNERLTVWFCGQNK